MTEEVEEYINGLGGSLDEALAYGKIVYDWELNKEWFESIEKPKNFVGHIPLGK